MQPSPPSATEAARALVEAGKLTGYQADAVLEKRFNDLLMGNYEILDRLGAGGMGTVFKARHRRMKRIVALKVLSQEVAHRGRLPTGSNARSRRLPASSHPNIVMAFDADESEAGPFLVMEFVNGRDLASEVDEAGLCRRPTRSIASSRRLGDWNTPTARGSCIGTSSRGTSFAMGKAW